MNCHKRPIILIVAIAALVCLGTAGVSPAAENRGNSAPANAFPKELKGVGVKDYFLPGKTKEAGIVQTVMSHVVVARGDLRQAYFAANGDKLYEGDVIFTLKGSRCRIKLHNNDVVTIAENSRLAIKQVFGKEDPQGKKSSLSMDRGKAMFYAIRNLSGKRPAMTVNSPTAVIGVRGTKFGVEVTEEAEKDKAKADDKTQSARPIFLADNSSDWGRHLILAQVTLPTGVGAAAGAGAVLGGSITTVHGFDGTVTVTGGAGSTGLGPPTVLVQPGTSLTVGPTGMGAAVGTPPAISQAFQNVTNVPPPSPGGGGSGGSSGSSGSSGGTSGGSGSGSTSGSSGSSGSGSGSTVSGSGSSGSGGLGGATGTTPTQVSNLSSITQNINTVTQGAVTATTSTVIDPQTNATGSNVGYFASIISEVYNETKTMAEVFASKNRYDGDSNVWARGLTYPATDYIRVLGNSGSGFATTPTLKWMVLGGGTKISGDVSKTVNSVDTGKSEYMNWGYATVPDAVVIDGLLRFANDNWTYFLFGKPATAVPSISATYNGSANGTYWTSDGGVNMTGYFKAYLNLTTGKLENFNLRVENTPTGKYASILEASGSVASDASFIIDTGTWSLNGSTPTYKSATGSFYGNSELGGIWAMRTSTEGAVGNFQGYSSFPAGTTLGSQKGHFVGTMDKNAEGTYTYVDTYMTTALQDFTTSPNPKAYNSNSTYSIEIEGKLGWPKNMTAASAASLTAWTGSLPVSFNRLGYKALDTAGEYVEWGYWTQTQAMTNSSWPHYVNTQGAFVWGTEATDGNMTTLKASLGSATYSGNAWGTMYKGGTSGTTMSGSFNSTVNFASSVVTNFNVSVSNSTDSVSIVNSQGAFLAGTGQTSTFAIDPTKGTWTINGNTASSALSGATGTVYGASGRSVGGVWKVGDSVNSKYATGGFVGSR